MNYLTADHLSSPRIDTDANGAVISRHDYMPFGEEIETAQRTSVLGYAADAVRKQFTSYERDVETQLDFAQARYSDFNLGRFSSPDPYNIIFEKEQAQTADKEKEMLNTYLLKPEQWNRYAYAINNPLKFADPSGELIYLVGTKEEQEKALKRFSELMGKDRMKNVSVYTICDAKLGDVTVIGAKNDGISAVGDTELNKEFSVRMADILESDKIVEYRFGEKYTKADGTTESLASQGGAATLGPDESTTGNIQIWVHPTLDTFFADNNASMPINAGLSNDGKALTFEHDMIDGHEFGHAWAGIMGYGTRGDDSKRVSVRMENAVRERYPSPQRRARHR